MVADRSFAFITIQQILDHLEIADAVVATTKKLKSDWFVDADPQTPTSLYVTAHRTGVFMNVSRVIDLEHSYALNGVPPQGIESYLQQVYGISLDDVPIHAHMAARLVYDLKNPSNDYNHILASMTFTLVAEVFKLKRQPGVFVPDIVQSEMTRTADLFLNLYDFLTKDRIPKGDLAKEKIISLDHFRTAARVPEVEYARTPGLLNTEIQKGMITKYFPGNRALSGYISTEMPLLGVRFAAYMNKTLAQRSQSGSTSLTVQ